MKRLLLSCLALGALVGAFPLSQWTLLYARSEARLRDFTAPPPFAVATLPTDAASLEKGRLLTYTRGCRGCHGEDLGGKVLEWSGRAVAVNLTRYVRDQDLATFERALRHGIGAEEKALVSMPSFMFRPLSDTDLIQLAAYLKSLPVIDDSLPEPILNRETRERLVNDHWPHMAQVTKEVPPLRHADRPETPEARGEYLAMTSCSECHGLDLRGWIEGEWFAPDLGIVASYSVEAFQRLMTEGVALGERELKMMSGVARKRFVHFTDEEQRALHAYLKTLASEPVPEDVFWRTQE